jgi:hypothetical protein
MCLGWTSWVSGSGTTGPRSSNVGLALQEAETESSPDPPPRGRSSSQPFGRATFARGGRYLRRRVAPRRGSAASPYVVDEEEVPGRGGPGEV